MNTREAEIKIAKILKDLETETDCIVNSVSLMDIEVTNIGDDRKKMVRSVMIGLERLPGTLWQV